MDDQLQAAFLIAQQKKFRPKSVLGLDLDRKARHLSGVANVPETVAARALVLYHLEAQRPMMGAFLDALGVAHEDGIIADEEMKAPPGETLAAAAKTLARAFPDSDALLAAKAEQFEELEDFGEITAQSRSGVGTTFTVRLPIVELDDDMSEDSLPPEPPSESTPGAAS